LTVKRRWLRGGMPRRCQARPALPPRVNLCDPGMKSRSSARSCPATNGLSGKSLRAATKAAAQPDEWCGHFLTRFAARHTGALRSFLRVHGRTCMSERLWDPARTSQGDAPSPPGSGQNCSCTRRERARSGIKSARLSSLYKFAETHGGPEFQIPQPARAESGLTVTSRWGRDARGPPDARRVQEVASHGPSRAQAGDTPRHCCPRALGAAAGTYAGTAALRGPDSRRPGRAAAGSAGQASRRLGEVGGGLEGMGRAVGRRASWRLRPGAHREKASEKRRHAPPTALGTARQKSPGARFSNLAKALRKAVFTVPVGPLRCLPMMISAMPGSLQASLV